MFFRTQGFDTKSAGTSKDAIRTVSITDLKWADSVIFMEEKHSNRVLAAFPRVMQFKRTQVLNILDDFELNDPNLVSIFKDITLR